ncbi:MAG TPA: M20 family metallopeptidase [Candidatus Wunengus sp. YC65]|uniref:M20 family metallopeptidase n=1 Tax=Candidatus Wunengus sp. YC65 TaxID=3367701 RepID=UPI0040290825
MQSKEKEIIDLTCKLINAKTENPPGDEILAVRIVEDFFKSLQIPYKIFEKTKNRANIVGYIGGKGERPFAPALLVACHLDVVPAGDDWKRNPFEAWIENGRIYGRGSSDNKGQMASMMAVARFLKENESKLKGQFILAGVADEERGSTLGLEYLLNECGIKADFAIIPDVAHNMQLIDVTEKGTLFLEITSHGKQAHGSRPEMGINAIWNMIPLLERIKQLKFKKTSHPLHTPPTLNLGSIHSGTSPNIVPAVCKAQLDIRYLPDDSADNIINDIKNIIREAETQYSPARFDLKIISNQLPTAVPINNPLVELISKHTLSILGTKPQPKGMSGATVTKQLIQKGITAVGFGPGDETEAHATNESISIKELVDFAKIMALITLDILT